MFANDKIKRKARQFHELRRAPDPCTTRGLSFTHFPKNTAGKGNLNRVGCPQVVKNEPDFDEVEVVIDYIAAGGTVDVA
jgi:hypothetical protein